MFENKLWLSSKFTKAQAWIDLFANANYKDGSFFVRNNEIIVKRGQLGWSELTMASRWKWSRERVRRFLKYLENEKNIRQQKTPLTTIITIVNYDKYQTNETADETTEPSKRDNRQDNRRDTNNKDNKDNNINKGTGSNTHKEEITSFFRKEAQYRELLDLFSKDKDRGSLESEFDKFILYWSESNGAKQRWQLQPVFDVKRRLFTWISKSNNFTNKKQTRIL